MKNYLRLKEKNLKKFKNEHFWEGNGSGAYNPIKIDSIQRQYTRLKLNRLKIFSFPIF